MDGPEGPILSPFFGKSDGLLFVEPDSGKRQFESNAERTAESLCNLAVARGALRLICGFIGPAHKAQLAGTGMDIRLGSGAMCIDELVAQFATLPKA